MGEPLHLGCLFRWTRLVVPSAAPKHQSNYPLRHVLVSTREDGRGDRDADFFLNLTQ